MKKLITIILFSTLSLSALSQGIFNSQIPQPNFISNDWDGDGNPNTTDPDDDNDGIADEDDSLPFGSNGQSSASPISFLSFNVDKYTIYSCQSAKLTWNVNNSQDMFIYRNGDKSDVVADVTGLTELSVNPTEYTEYYLDYLIGESDALPISISGACVLPKSNGTTVTGNYTTGISQYTLNRDEKNKYEATVTTGDGGSINYTPNESVMFTGVRVYYNVSYNPSNLNVHPGPVRLSVTTASDSQSVLLDDNYSDQISKSLYVDIDFSKADELIAMRYDFTTRRRYVSLNITNVIFY